MELERFSIPEILSFEFDPSFYRCDEADAVISAISYQRDNANQQLSIMKQEKLEQERKFTIALDRIWDLLQQDDGQAYKEAERFYERHKQGG